MRSSWIRIGPKSNVLIGQDRAEGTERHGRKPHANVAGIGVRLRQNKERKNPERARRHCPLEPSEGAWLCSILIGFLTSRTGEDTFLLF